MRRGQHRPCPGPGTHPRGQAMIRSGTGQFCQTPLVSLLTAAWMALGGFVAATDISVIPLTVRRASAEPNRASPSAQNPTLSEEDLVEQVLARNPSVAQMEAAWRAASARYPQVTSLDDPMLGATFGPASIGSRDVDFAYRLEVAQKLPFPGKRGLRGASAQAEAEAAGNDVEDMRLQLAESAKSAFYDYYLVARALEVNEETVRRLREFKSAAEALYRSPPRDRKVSLQEVIQADVEIGRQQERQLTLQRMREVAVARINTLLDQPPDCILPPPPRELTVRGSLPEVQALRAAALERRPDLRALANRIAAEEAVLALAHKEFYPDFEVMAAYDRFWQSGEKDLRPQ